MYCLVIKLLAAIELTALVVVWLSVYRIMCPVERDQTFSVSLEVFKQSLLQLNIEIGKMAKNGVMYNPPSQDILSFIEQLNNIINDMRMENKVCYLGYHNSNTVEWRYNAVQYNIRMYAELP